MARPQPRASAWNPLRDLFSSTDWSSELKTVTSFAFDVLESELGRDWPQRAADRFGVPAALGQTSGSHIFAIANLVTLALRFDAVASVPGKGKLRRSIRNPSDEEFLHASVLLEVAALALSQGWEVELEPAAEGLPPADVRLSNSSLNLLVEARVVTRSRASLEAGRWSDALRQRLRAQCYGGVWIVGRVTRELNEEVVDDLVAEATARASFVRGGGVATALTWPGVHLEVVREADFGPNVVDIPLPKFDPWGRLRAAIAEKGERTAASGATWLRIDMAHLLWEAPLGPEASFEERVAAFVEPVRQWASAYSHLEGVVMTNALWTTYQTVEIKEVDLGEGAVGLRVPVDRARTRETVILPLSSRSGAVKGWRGLYLSEAGWSAAQLMTRDLPVPFELAVPA